jgi:hypothetical protein
MFDKVMNNLQIGAILKRVYPFYDCHVTAIDKLKNIPHKMNQIIVVNYQKSTDYGSHWVLILCIDTRFAEYMDSFGLPPPDIILNYMRGYKKNKIVDELIMTTKKVQKMNEEICGWYVIKYLELRIKDKEEPYLAINNINYNNTIKYAKQLSKKYL